MENLDFWVGFGFGFVAAVIFTVYVVRFTRTVRLFVPNGDKMPLSQTQIVQGLGRARVPRLKHVVVRRGGENVTVYTFGGADDYVDGQQFEIRVRHLPLLDREWGALFVRHTVLLSNETPVEVFLWSPALPPDEPEKA